MDFRINLACFLLLVSLRINSVLGLKCHVCNSLNNASCEAIEKDATQFLQSCYSPTDVTCRVQEQWVDFDVLGQKHEKRVIRQCASTPYDADRPCYYRTGFGGRTNVCNCQGDACNEAPGTGPSLLLLLLGLFCLSKLF